MKPQMRFFWMIALMFFTTGCSGYQVACYTRTEGSLEPGQDVGETCDLKPGDQVEVTLVDGNQAEGVVQIISSSEIVLDAQGKNPQPRGYSIAQVQSIRKKPSKSKSNTLESTRETINPGDDVRLVLVDGIQVRGTVKSISSKEIVLEHQDQSDQPNVYSSDQIHSIETESTGGPSTSQSLVIVGVFVVIIGAGILASSMSDLSGGFMGD